MSDKNKVVSLFEPTPRTALERTLDMVDEIDQIYLVVRDKDGHFRAAGSLMSQADKSLLIHYAQLDMMEDLFASGEEDDSE